MSKPMSSIYTEPEAPCLLRLCRSSLLNASASKQKRQQLWQLSPFQSTIPQRRSFGLLCWQMHIQVMFAWYIASDSLTGSHVQTHTLRAHTSCNREDTES